MGILAGSIYGSWGGTTAQAELAVNRPSAAVVERFGSALDVAADIKRTVKVASSSFGLNTFGNYTTAGTPGGIVIAVDQSRNLAFMIMAGRRLAAVDGTHPQDDLQDDILNIVTKAPMNAYAAACTARGLTCKILNMIVASDGAWLLCLGHEAIFNAALWADGAGYGTGEIYRSTDEGTTWTRVLTMKNGFPASWGYKNAVRGNQIIVGEYGTFESSTSNPRNIYLSEDNGLTWTAIFEPPHNEDAAMKSHIHELCWIDDDSFLELRGDERYRGVYRHIRTGGVWQTPVEIYDGQVTAAIVDGGFVLYGNDDAQMGGVIVRQNLTTLEFEPVLKTPLSSTTANLAFASNSIGSGCWTILKHNGVYYARVDDYWNAVAGRLKQSNGIWVSKDGIYWCPAYREELSTAGTAQGGGWLAGIVNDRLWWIGTNNSGSRSMAMTLVDVRTLDGYQVAPGITNALNNANVSTTFDTGHGWIELAAGGAIARESAAAAYHGDFSLKRTLRAQGGGSIDSPLFSTLLGRPEAGDKITASVWVKGGPVFTEPFEFSDGMVGNYRLNLTFVTSGTISLSQLSTAASYRYYAGSLWTKITAYAYVTSIGSDGDISLRVGLTANVSSNYSYPQAESGGKSYWIDAATVVYSRGAGSRYFYELGFQPGGTARGNEHLVLGVNGAGRTWSLATQWHPRTPFAALSANLPILTVLDDSGNAVDLVWDETSKKFTATDGSASASSADASARLFCEDWYRFVLVYDDGLTLYIETPEKGLLTAIDASAVKLPGLPVAVLLGTDGTAYGAGAYSRVQFWKSEALTEAKAQAEVIKSEGRVAVR